MKRLFASLATFFALLGPAAATPADRAAMNTEINTNLPSNNAGQIRATDLRQTLLDLVAGVTAYAGDVNVILNNILNQVPAHSFIGNNTNNTDNAAYVPFGSLALLGVGTGLTSDGVNLNVTPITPGAVVNILDYYVNNSTGSDGVNSDCLAATVSGGHSPCLTIQHAINLIAPSSQPVTVHLAGSTYTATVGVSNPINLVIDGGGLTINAIGIGAGAYCGVINAAGSGVNITVENMTLGIPDGPCGGPGEISAFNGATVTIGTGVTFGPITVAITGFHMSASNGGVISAPTGYTISGAAGAHVWERGGAVVDIRGVVTCSAGGYAFGAFGGDEFYHVLGASTLEGFNTFSGCGSETGKRYLIAGGSVLEVSSDSYFSSIPGDAVGEVQSGGRIYPAPVPTLGTCTNGNFTASNQTDNSFVVNFTGVSSSCAVNFGSVKVNSPICVASGSSSTLVTVTAIAASVTLTGSFINLENVYVHCFDTPD